MIVRGTQLVNAMKNMDISDIRPREVINVEDDKDKVLANSNVQASGSHDQNQTSASDHKVQDQQVASSSQANESNAQPSASDQAQVRQLVHSARDHPLDQIVGDIRSGVKTRSRLALFCEHYSFVSSFEPTKIEDALMDVDWVNAMHEELNNFTRKSVGTS